MADSILPWISDHLIGIGEECGANISSIPLFEKKKKVQLVEVSWIFLELCRFVD
jgi:hypothetical protein